MNSLNPLKMPLNGVNLIEASAGTGKTYTITSLYLRLILEQELIPDRILVVTFTEAATRELKERIRERLAAALSFLQSGETDDDFVRDYVGIFFQGEQERKRARALLFRAVDRLDLAAIFTIHAFCRRVLQEHAFTSGALFQEDLIKDESARLRRVIDDYWRLNLPVWPEPIIAYLHQQNTNPDTLFEEFASLVGHVIRGGNSVILSPEISDPVDFDADRIIRDIVSCWQQERSGIVDLLMASKALSRGQKTYREDRLQSLIALIDDFVSNNKVLPLAALTDFSITALVKGTKKSREGETPAHLFFDLCEDLITGLNGVFHFIRRDLLLYCAEELPHLKRKEQVFSFDDLLIGVRDGLWHEGEGDEFAGLIRQQFPVALIDEFQDTDPVQFDIFNTVYAAEGSTLIMIGDPKQAIYSFRGADIFAYLKAARKVEPGRCFTLDINYRAADALVLAVNSLFKGKDPFGLTEIKFTPVSSRPEIADHFSLDNDHGEGLALVKFKSQLAREETKKDIAASLALEVENLLQKGGDGKAAFNNLDKSRPLAAGDIAVLVRTHKEGETVGSALGERNLKSLSCSPLSVYASTEARELVVILEAVYDPFNDRKVRSAIATKLLTVGRFDETLASEQRWEEVLTVFSDCRQIWSQKGVSVMMSELFSRLDANYHQASWHNGERLLTNVRHLVELLQQAAHDLALGPAALKKWLAGQINENKNTEEAQLRLESDENLIRIITIHKSKGLEFPVVFCPFLWDTVPRLKGKKSFAFHDTDGELKLELGSAGAAGHRDKYNQEQLAEGLRLAYVALTRARYRCYLWQAEWKSPRPDDLAYSPLNYLMKTSALSDLLANEEPCSTGICSLAVGSGLDISLSRGQDEIGDYRRLPGPIKPGWSVQSFSALHRQMAATFSSTRSGPWQPQKTDDPATLNRFTLPKGAATGSCLHLIFEHLDFTKSNEEEILPLITFCLKQYGFSDKWVPVIYGMTRDVLKTELDPQLPGLSLSVITADQRLDEMEFYITTPQLPPDQLGDIFARAMMNDGAGELTSLSRIEHGAGFIKGFIDLLFYYQGRYYLVDYKSNHLGNESGDYGKDQLDLAMSESRYDLQYYIYLVALHRFLGKRLADYDYDRHFGGVYYLFVRGMRPGSGSGIFRDRPGFEVVNRLDRQLGGGDVC